jgi:dTDP-L-rhamnose 4-epimerase
MDVRDPLAWDALLKLVTPDRIVHLAAETGTGISLSHATRHASTNVVGTAALIDALTRSGHLPEHIVLASSRAVYGEGEWTSGGRRFYPGQRTHAELAAGDWDPKHPDGRLATAVPGRADRTVPHPTSVYGATKLAQEHTMAAWSGAKGVDLSILRLQNVYGPGQSLTNSYTGIVTLFSRLASEGATLDVYEDGNIVRDFVFIDDVIAALLAVLDRPSVSEPIDIGSGAATTILDMACLIAQLLDAPAPKVTGKFRDGDVRAASADITVARDRLEYAPAWTLRSGLTTLFSWIETSASSPAQKEG